MRILLKRMEIKNPKKTSRLETQLHLRPLGSTSSFQNLTVPVAIEITFPEHWLTASIIAVKSLECRLELLVDFDASLTMPLPKLEENPAQLILTDSPLI